MKQSLESQMIDGVFPPKKSRKLLVASSYDAGAKTCFECFRVMYNAVRVCPACGYEFYPSKAKK